MGDYRIVKRSRVFYRKDAHKIYVGCTAGSPIHQVMKRYASYEEARASLLRRRAGIHTINLRTGGVCLEVVEFYIENDGKTIEVSPVPVEGFAMVRGWPAVIHECSSCFLLAEPLFTDAHIWRASAVKRETKVGQDGKVPICVFEWNCDGEHLDRYHADRVISTGASFVITGYGSREAMVQDQYRQCERILRSQSLDKAEHRV